MTTRNSLLLLASVAVSASAAAAPEPDIGSRAKPIIAVQSLKFKDLDGSGQLDAYEDWRLPPQKRAADLVRRMTLAEKAGVMQPRWCGRRGLRSGRFGSAH